MVVTLKRLVEIETRIENLKTIDIIDINAFLKSHHRPMLNGKEEEIIEKLNKKIINIKSYTKKIDRFDTDYI